MPRQSITIRLEVETRRRLISVARRRGRTTSTIIREAVASWLATEQGLQAASPYETMSDLIGCVRGADPRRSTRGRRAIAAGLRARRKRRR